MKKIVMFSGISSKTGTTTIAREFAAQLSSHWQKKIVLINFTYEKFNSRKLTLSKNIDFFNDIYSSDQEVIQASKFNGRKYPVMINFNLSDKVASKYIESTIFSDFINKVRSNFDYVIMDTPPVREYSDSQILCSKADCIILIVEAGKTSRLSAIQTKKEIMAIGANILGVIINKRNYYIPNWIYNKL